MEKPAIYAITCIATSFLCDDHCNAVADGFYSKIDFVYIGLDRFGINIKDAISFWNSTGNHADAMGNVWL